MSYSFFEFIVSRAELSKWLRQSGLSWRKVLFNGGNYD